jgi:hypothetical protein
MAGAVVPLVLQKWVLPQDRIGLYMQLLIGVGLLLQLRFYPDGVLISQATKRERRRDERLRASVAAEALSVEKQGAAV